MATQTIAAIEFENVSHCFRVHSEGKIGTLKEWLIRRITGNRGRSRVIAALDSVTFSVARGQALGVIGHNGAGKSTLLRIAAGILQPSGGAVVIRGRIAPVIELGIGFEQELTGRENIVFNGALLGRSHQEMADRMGEIVDFSELGEFIDRPLRTYSTGMVARLAFAVATTVDAHVLLLDEVLSVGDERFRRKCLQRISEFRAHGVTTLYVSHDLEAVRELCDEVIWLDRGVIRQRGPSADVVELYRNDAEIARDDRA